MVTYAVREAQNFLASSFSEAIERSMSKATKAAWQGRVEEEVSSPTDGGAAIYLQIAISGGLKGVMVLKLSNTDALLLGSKVLSEPAPMFGGQHGEAVLTVVKAAQVNFLDALMLKYGDMRSEVAIVTELPSGALPVVRLVLSGGEEIQTSILLYLDSDLQQSVAARCEPEKAGRAAAQVAPAVAARLSVSDERKLQRVLDVPLNVKLRFGQRQLTLREVLDLNTGSLVELDRQVEEPVDLILDGKVIARGEVVIVDGNYGMRITEVTQPAMDAIVNM